MKKFSLFILFLVFLLAACGKVEKKEENSILPIPTKAKDTSAVKYAKGFTISKENNLTVIKVSSPWPESEKEFSYALIDRDKLASITIDVNAYDAIIAVPVERCVVTSTTHIPALEALNVAERLVGFPGTKYISSTKTRELIENGKVRELGKNEAINTEVLIDLAPELVVGFSINNHNKAYETIQKSGIPVVYNGDWTEQSPLGKAEWIKFFAPFFKKEKLADSLFSSIENQYIEAKTIASGYDKQPTVLAGSMYKDIWYLPAGNSWAAQFIEDANANYLWQDSEGTGSLSLNLENVLDKGREADYWIGPGQFTSYAQMISAHQLYSKFNSFKNHTIFTYSSVKGETGGLLYYELAPNRPDLVLKDLISILHPNALPDHELVFFKPLE